MSEKLELRDEERQRCEVWTRVMGYHRPVSAFNPGKQSEHAERVHYLEERCRSGFSRDSDGAARPTNRG